MKTGKTEIVCVGILCADILGKTVNEFPEKGKLSLVDKISLDIGGCAANVAISLSKLGLPATIAGKVGRDSLGDFLKNALTVRGVDIRGLVTDDHVSTSASMVMISDDGERSIVHSMGANRYFRFEDIDPAMIAESKILLIAGTFLMPSFDGRGTESLLRFAQSRGVLCCMDTAWDSTGQWMNRISAALPYLDWFMPSYDESCELTGETDPRTIAEKLIAHGVKNVIIKLNAEGCYVRPQDQEGFLVPSYNRVEPVDSSGAGDSFCAGFITGLYQGWDIAQCAAFANAVGAHCIMEIGTTSGIRPMNDILAFMETYELRSGVR